MAFWIILFYFNFIFWEGYKLSVEFDSGVFFDIGKVVAFQDVCVVSPF